MQQNRNSIEVFESSVNPGAEGKICLWIFYDATLFTKVCIINSCTFVLTTKNALTALAQRLMDTLHNQYHYLLTSV